jgi:phosphatidate cytidylyltransferase
VLSVPWSDWSRWTLHLHLGPLEVGTTGRGVFLFWLTVVALALAGVGVALARKPELRRRWVTWALIAPVAGIPIWLGPAPTAVLAAVIAVQAAREYGRLTGLPGRDTVILVVLGAAFPLVALVAPQYLGLTPLVALATAAVPLFEGDIASGFRRASLSAFAVVWICWSLAHLVLLWSDAYLLCFAAAAADVAAWCGGKGLRRFSWTRRPLSPLSPNKTVGGVVGAVLGASLLLLVAGHLNLGWVVAIGLGGILGDLLESMVKRQSGVKDAGRWLPGFGGLLDRVDSLLIVLPLAMVLA